MCVCLSHIFALHVCMFKSYICFAWMNDVHTCTWFAWMYDLHHVFALHGCMIYIQVLACVTCVYDLHHVFALHGCMIYIHVLATHVCMIFIMCLLCMGI